MRDLILFLGALALAPSACEKPASSTTPPSDDGGGAAAASSGEAAAATTAPDTGTETEPGAPGVPWAQKDFKQRQEFMGLTVLPKMKAVFQAHDATGFGTFKCQTCHGDDGQAKKYKMPNNGIYPLPAADPIKAAKAYDEKMAAFMIERVTPQMAELFGEKADTPDKAKGFCMRCHPTE